MSQRNPAKLIVPLEQARQQTSERIIEGEHLLKHQITNEGEFRAARDQYYTWNEYNETMVDRLTDSEGFIYAYRSRVAVGAIGENSLADKIRELHDDIRTKLRRLESIRGRLGLLEDGAASQLQTIDHRPRIFIAHGGHSTDRDQLELFLWRNGMRPIIVEEMPSLGMNPDAKVRHYMSSSDFAVILAEASRPSSQDGKLYPRLNIVDEIARVREMFESKFIILLHSELNLPTNESSAITWESFRDGFVSEIFGAVGRELKANGIDGKDE